MVLLIFLLSFLPSFRRWVINVVYSKNLNLAKDKKFANKIIVLGQDYFIDNKKIFFAAP